MTEDYKHVVPPPEQSKGSPWMLPLLLALVSAGLATWWLTYHPEEAATPTTAPLETETSSQEADQKQGQETEGPAKAAPEEQAQPPEQQFDFYTVLPQMEVPIINLRTSDKPPERRKQKTTDTKKNPEAKPASGNRYFLQIGSFQQEQAATELRDKVRAMDLQGSIQKVRLLNSGVWYRVNIGPFKDLDSSDHAQEALEQHGIRYTLMKQISQGQPN